MASRPTGPGAPTRRSSSATPRQAAGRPWGSRKIDLQTLALTPIHRTTRSRARAELTGTGDGRLYGAFEGTPYVVAEIQKTNAHILSQASAERINYAPGSSNFAFAFWGGDFWLFVGPGLYTDVFQYKPSNGSTTLVKTVQFVVVGRGRVHGARRSNPRTEYSVPEGLDHPRET